jgi:lactate permease
MTVDTALAAAPIIAVLVLMVGLGWSAVRAGLVAAAGTVIIALTVFDFAGDDDPFDPAAGVLGVAAEAAWVTLTVIAIIGPALAVHELQQRTNATAVLQTGLSRLTPDPRVAALLIAWFFALFLEGAAGFGTPIALAAPFLVAAGFRPVEAVSAALVGHAVGVSFGAVGTPVLAQVAASGFTGAELARATVPYHTILGWILTAVVVVLIGRSVPEGGPPWRWGALAAGAFFVPYFLIGRFVGPELPTLGGALIGAVVFVAVVVMVRRRTAASGTAADADTEPDRDGAANAVSSVALLRAGAPYLAIVALVLVTRLLTPVRDLLFDVVVDWRIFDDFTGTVRPLYHPGLLLPVAFAIGALAQGATARDVRQAIGTTNRRLIPVVVALVAMVTIARTMSQSGMTDELAQAPPVWEARGRCSPPPSVRSARSSPARRRPRTSCSPTSRSPRRRRPDSRCFPCSAPRASARRSATSSVPTTSSLPPPRWVCPVGRASFCAGRCPLRSPTWHSAAGSPG